MTQLKNMACDKTSSCPASSMYCQRCMVTTAVNGRNMLPHAAVPCIVHQLSVVYSRHFSSAYHADWLLRETVIYTFRIN